MRHVTDMMYSSGVGHFLGLDVHDVDGNGSPIPNVLLPGHVVTCEPGIYFVESLLEPVLAETKKVVCPFLTCLLMHGLELITSRTGTIRSTICALVYRPPC